MKKWIALLLTAAALLSLTACSMNRDLVVQIESDRTDAAASLRVVTSYGGDDGNRGNFEAAVRSFEAETGIQVLDDSANSNEEWKAKVITDFETDSEPDVLFFFTNADAEPFIQAGKVVSIEEIRSLYPDYADNMKPHMLAVAADGKQYAVPSSGFWENLFVNKSVLSDCGLEVPGPDYTWEEFLSDCLVIRRHGYTPIACSLFEVPHYWFEFAVMNNGSWTTQREVPGSADDRAGQKWVAALNDIKDLYEQGFFPRNTLTATDAETVAMFCRNQAAFLIDGSWKVGYFTENYPDNLENITVSFVPGKGERQATEGIGGISMGYFITRKAWEDPVTRDAAVAFVRHLTSDDVLSTFVTTEITALRRGAQPAGLNPLQQSAADTASHLTEVVSPVQDRITGEAKGTLFASIQNVVTGALSPEEAINRAIALNNSKP